MSAPLVVGAGEPVTLVAHGLGATLPETRALAGGVSGTRVLPVARGHGDVPLDGSADYALLGRDLEAVADAHGATRALGVSMGTGALLSLLTRRPDRFTRLVLMLPGALDRPRHGEAVDGLAALAGAVERGDGPAVRAWLDGEVPADLRRSPGVAAALDARAAWMLASPGLPLLARTLPRVVPVPDPSVLGAVTAEVLVLAQEGDALHPADVGRALAAALPRARLVVLPGPGALVRERARVRGLVREHLGGEAAVHSRG